MKMGTSQSSRRRRNPRRKKVNICVEYFAQVGRRSMIKFLLPEGSSTDHETKRAEIEHPTTHDNGPSAELKERKKKKKKAKDTEGPASSQVEDTPSE